MEARLLGPSDADRVRELCSADPVRHCFVASRVDAGVLDPRQPGELWGHPAAAPRSLLHVGANCVPVATDAAARAAFVTRLGPHRPFVSIVGPQQEALALLDGLRHRWGAVYGRTRLVRERQPLMVLEGESPLAGDPRVQPLTLQHLDSYFAAAVAMYTEELGESPLVANPRGYRSYVRGLIESGRAFGIVEDDEVVFKADIGAVGGGVAQVQGVWLRPDQRGRGLAAPAMAAVSNRVTGRGLAASLYVNDFNGPAIATYLRCGYREVGAFASVLY